MGHKSRGDCPIATAVFIRKQADKKGLSVREMIKEYSRESGLPKDTLDRWLWPRKPSAVKSDGDNNTLRKNIHATAGTIKKSEVADEDVKNDDGPDAPIKFRRLWQHILAVSDGLQQWADGEMKPDSEDDKISVKGIMAALPYLIRQAARLGVDLKNSGNL